MPEIRRNVKIVEVDYKCPECTTGYLRPTGTVYTTYPPMIPHRYNNPFCNHGETFTSKQYPYIDYEPIENDLLDTLDGE